jgi:ABC-type glycerol-3-phosphate transport system substrate-binding protein
LGRPGPTSGGPGHPGATAEFGLTTGNDLEKFVVAAGTPLADLGDLSITYGRDLHDKGAFLEVDAVIRQVPDLAPAKCLDAANDYRTAGGGHFSLPAWANSSGRPLNSGRLRRAGLDPQGANLKTWDDLLRSNQALTACDGAGKPTQPGFPFALPGLEEWAT